MHQYSFIRKNTAFAPRPGLVGTETTGEDLIASDAGGVTVLLNPRRRRRRPELSSEALRRRFDTPICCRPMQEDEAAGRFEIPPRKDRMPILGRRLMDGKREPFAFCPHCGQLIDIVSIKRTLHHGSRQHT